MKSSSWMSQCHGRESLDEPERLAEGDRRGSFSLAAGRVTVAGMRGQSFVIRAMTQSDANAVAAWHYSGSYSFYDWEQDAEDLAELLYSRGMGATVLRC